MSWAPQFLSLWSILEAGGKRKNGPSRRLQWGSTLKQSLKMSEREILNSTVIQKGWQKEMKSKSKVSKLKDGNQTEAWDICRQTLKSLRASVCSASEGRVVRGKHRPSLQKLKALLFHSSLSENKGTHFVHRDIHKTEIEFQICNESTTDDSTVINTVCSANRSWRTVRIKITCNTLLSKSVCT